MARSLGERLSLALRRPSHAAPPPEPPEFGALTPVSPGGPTRGLASGSPKNGAQGSALGSKGVNGNGGRVNGGRVNGGRVNGGRVNGGRVNGGRVNGGRVNGGRVNGGRVNGGRVNGGRVNGGRVNGGRVNGGRVNGGRVNGGRVNGGRVNGGRVNGNGSAAEPMPVVQWQNARRRRTVAVVALLVAVSVSVPLLALLSPPPEPIVIDGRFGDWEPVAAYPDAVFDLPGSAGTNLVGFAAVIGHESLYLYAQTASGEPTFGEPGSSGPARSIRFLIDSDRSSATGYVALGLGVDQVVEVVGGEGQLRSTDVLSYARGRADRTDPTAFAHTAVARASSSGNQLEAAVALTSLGDLPDAGPFVVAVAQDSEGRTDIGDLVFTPLPGAMSVVQAQGPPPVIPNDSDVVLLSLEVRAIHFPLALSSLPLRVEGGGGAVTVSRVVFGPATLPLNASAAPGGTIVIPISRMGPSPVAPGAGPRTLEVWGRASGPVGASAVRLFAGPTELAHSSGGAPGVSGHVSVLPPAAFESSYVGAAPASVRVDGAFADWDAWAPLDADPVGDATGPAGGASPGTSNPGPGATGPIDITATRAVLDASGMTASFLLTVEGSLMSSQDLPPPRPLTREVAAPGGSGGGAPAPLPRGDTATVYIDTDANASTGWAHFPGLGVDAVVVVRGAGGGWGRTPSALSTSVGQWNASAATFDERALELPVGFGSSRLETQVAAADLCGGPCGALRYVFHLQAPSGANDETAAHASSSRSGGDRLLLYESAAGVRTAFAGDAHVPLLALTVSALSTNGGAANLSGVWFTVGGLNASDMAGASLYNDLEGDGAVGPEDVARGPLAVGALAAGGAGHIPLDPPLAVVPGAALSLLLAVDIVRDAPTPAFATAALLASRPISTSEPFDWELSSDTGDRAVRILPYAPGSRGQNEVVINEVNFVQGWVELYHTLGTAVNLSSPSQMGVEVWRTNPPQNKYFVEQIALVGSTDSNGYFTLNMTLPYSGSGKTYFLSLWCNNCSAGRTAQGNNTTYVDSITLPTSTVNGMYGRYPNGNGGFTTTTNDTKGAANKIPEFEELVLPLGATVLLVAAARRSFPAAHRRGHAK